MLSLPRYFITFDTVNFSYYFALSTLLHEAMYQLLAEEGTGDSVCMLPPPTQVQVQGIENGKTKQTKTNKQNKNNMNLSFIKIIELNHTKFNVSRPLVHI